MSVQTEPVPPSPDHTPPVESDASNPAGKYFNHTWLRWFNSIREKINVINELIAALASLIGGSGIIVVDEDEVFLRTIQGTAGNIAVANGDGVAGDPTVNLVATGVTPGSYTSANLTVDVMGRLTAASNGSGGGGGGGPNNLLATYYVDSAGNYLTDSDGNFLVQSFGVPITQIFTLASNFVSSSTTLASITDGVRPWSFSLTAGKTYRITMIGAHQTGVLTTGIKLFVNFSGALAGTIIGTVYGSIARIANATELKATLYTFAGAAGAGITLTGVNPINGAHDNGLDFIFVCTGDGTMFLQFASEVAASAATLLAQSTLIVQEL